MFFFLGIDKICVHPDGVECEYPGFDPVPQSTIYDYLKTIKEFSDSTVMFYLQSVNFAIEVSYLVDCKANFTYFIGNKDPASKVDLNFRTTSLSIRCFSFKDIKVSTNINKPNLVTTSFSFLNSEVVTPELYAISVTSSLFADPISFQKSPTLIDKLRAQIFMTEIDDSIEANCNCTLTVLTSFKFIITTDAKVQLQQVSSEVGVASMVEIQTAKTKFSMIYERDRRGGNILFCVSDSTMEVNSSLNSMLALLNITSYYASKIRFTGVWPSSMTPPVLQCLGNDNDAELTFDVPIQLSVALRHVNAALKLPPKPATFPQILLSYGKLTVIPPSEEDYHLTVTYFVIDQKASVQTNDNVLININEMSWSSTQNESLDNSFTGGKYRVFEQMQTYLTNSYFDYLELTDGVAIYSDFEIGSASHITVYKKLIAPNAVFYLYFNQKGMELNNELFLNYTINHLLTPLIIFPSGTKPTLRFEFDKGYQSVLGFSNESSILSAALTDNRFGFQIFHAPNEVYKIICIFQDSYTNCPTDASAFLPTEISSYLGIVAFSRTIQFLIIDPLSSVPLIDLTQLVDTKERVQILTDHNFGPQKVYVKVDHSLKVTDFEINNVALTLDITDQQSHNEYAVLFTNMTIGQNCTQLKGFSEAQVLKVIHIDLDVEIMNARIFNLADHKSVVVDLGSLLREVQIGNSNVFFNISDTKIEKPDAPRAIISFNANPSYLRYGPIQGETVHSVNEVNLVWKIDETPTLEIAEGWIEQSPQNLKIQSLDTVKIRVVGEIVPVAFAGVSSVELISPEPSPVLFTGTVKVENMLTFYPRNISKLSFSLLELDGLFSEISLENQKDISNFTADNIVVTRGSIVTARNLTLKNQLMINQQSSIELPGAELDGSTFIYRPQVGCPSSKVGFDVDTTFPSHIIVQPLNSECGTNSISNESIQLICGISEGYDCERLRQKVTFDPQTVFWGSDNYIAFESMCITSGASADYDMCLCYNMTLKPRDVSLQFMTQGDVITITVMGIFSASAVGVSLFYLFWFSLHRNVDMNELDEEERYYFNSKYDD